MTKKSLIFIVMTVVFTVTILCIVGFIQVDKAREAEKKKVRVMIRQKPEEVKIIAVEEKKPSPVRKVTKRKETKAKKPSKKNPTKKESMAKTPISEKKSVKPVKLADACLRLDHSMIEDGRKLISKETSIPIVQTSDDHIGFNYYLAKMQDMGGRLFVGDAFRHEILAEAIISKKSGRFQVVTLAGKEEGMLNGMALFRPREIVREGLVDEIISLGRQTYGDRDLRCVLILPLDLEAGILGAFNKYLNSSGYQISSFDIVWGHYLKSEDTLRLKLEKGRISKTQKIVQLGMVLVM